MARSHTSTRTEGAHQPDYPLMTARFSPLTPGATHTNATPHMDPGHVGHSMHDQDPQLFTDTITDWGTKILSSGVLHPGRTDNGLWALPGGAQDLGESVVEAARRQVHEETGIDVEIY
jgi:NUDIX domain